MHKDCIKQKAEENKVATRKYKSSEVVVALRIVRVFIEQKGRDLSMFYAVENQVLQLMSGMTKHAELYS